MGKWSLTHLMRLLRYYAAHRCLWDIRCKDNRNRKMRQAAIIDITAALDIGVTKEQVIQKINILRATYRYEKKRIKQRIRRWLGAQTKLKWFALADAFLRNVPKRVQKHKDPSNSDSDLEDTVVFTINPEALMPLEKEFSTEVLEEYSETDENYLQKEQGEIENVQIDSPALEENKSKSSNNKGLQYIFNQNENNEKINNNLCDPGQNFVKKQSWEFKDTIRFLQLLEYHSVVFQNSLVSVHLHQTLLESIARDMNYSFKTIEKRWNILENILKEENNKILQNSKYIPNYKWWPEAEKLLFKTFRPAEAYNVPDGDMPTEFKLLKESRNLENNAFEQCENKLLLNPIRSVSSLSDMNEELYDNHNDEDFLEQLNTNFTHSHDNLVYFPERREFDLAKDYPFSNTCSIRGDTPGHNDVTKTTTNCTYPKEMESPSSSKFVWHGLEVDLLEGKWSLKHSVKFLRLYGAHRCLWDLNEPDYRSRALRNAAIEDIAASMGHGLTASHVAKKIRIFRITYMQQRKRLLKAAEKGENPEVLLKWFPLADSFLRPHIGLRSIKPDAKEMPQFDYQYVYANLNLIDPALLTDFSGKGTQNAIEIGIDNDKMDVAGEEA